MVGCQKNKAGFGTDLPSWSPTEVRIVKIHLSEFGIFQIQAYRKLEEKDIYSSPNNFYHSKYGD